MILSTMESGGMDIYLAATEDTKIRAKTTDQIIIIEKCFITIFQDHIPESNVKDTLSKFCAA
jgi:hypothetical protein